MISFLFFMTPKIDIYEIRAIQKKMIKMLKNKKKYGGAHTETIHLGNCVPKHLRGKKIVDVAIKELFTKKILINKKSTGEQHCSSQVSKREERRLAGVSSHWQCL